jgi:hypothetical protein
MENPELKALESQLQEVKVSSRKDIGAAEVPVSCGKNEALPRETHCTTTNPYYPE